MKTWIVVVGLLLMANMGFGMGHPHNLFAARHRLVARLNVARLEAARQTPSATIARSIPGQRESSPTAQCRSWFRQLLPEKPLRLKF
jgi:hypothetical protein